MSLSKNILLSFDISFFRTRQPMTDRIESLAAIQFPQFIQFHMGHMSTCLHSIHRFLSLAWLFAASQVKLKNQPETEEKETEKPPHPTTTHHHDHRRWQAGRQAGRKGSYRMNETKMSLPPGLLDGIAPKGDLFYAEEGRSNRKRCAWLSDRERCGGNLRRLISLERSIKAIFIPFCLL